MDLETISEVKALPSFKEEEVVEALGAIYRAMLDAEQVMVDEAGRHWQVFAAQMRAGGVERARLEFDESYLDYDQADFQLQYVRTLERLFERTERYMEADGVKQAEQIQEIDAPLRQLERADAIRYGHDCTLTEQMLTKAIDLRAPLVPQMQERLLREQQGVRRRFDRHLYSRRQQAVGIQRYIWRSRDDERVRGSHAANDDLEFVWENPPATGHPGQDYGCRCWAEPVMGSLGDARFDADIESIDTHVRDITKDDFPSDEELQDELDRLSIIDPPIEPVYPEVFLVPMLRLRVVISRIIGRTARKLPKPELRKYYEYEVRNLSTLEKNLRQAGKKDEQIARYLHRERREIGQRYKELTPVALRNKIYDRNLKRYGDRYGPTIDYLRKQGKTWEDIINSAKRPGGSDLF